MKSPIDACAALWVTMPESVWKWIHRLGGPGLILLGIADNTPFISAPPGSGHIRHLPLGTASSMVGVLRLHGHGGEVLGGYFTYRLAQRGGHQTLEKKISKPRAERLYRTFERRATLTILCGALLPPPFPFTSVPMAAGVMQYPHRKFLSALITGRAFRFFAVACFGRIYGQQLIAFFSHYYRPTIYLLIALAITGSVGVTVYFKFYRPKAQKTQREESERGEQVHRIR
ncbi:MAG TPA: VTT domain-containing protein [Terriglobales bacterium]|nr:VTT domain-containing protein [Terriglobales bacterium]